eukprot:6561982-Lingulodinium_polyedra.AAC.1
MELRLAMLKERAGLREAGGLSEQTAELDLAVARLSRRLRQARKARARLLEERRLEQLWQAWRERDLSRVHRLVRQLTKRGIGARKRYYNNSVGPNPSK